MRHASGTGGGPGLSPIHDPDGDDMDNDLETENIVADPYKESPLVLRKKHDSGSTISSTN